MNEVEIAHAILRFGLASVLLAFGVDQLRNAMRWAEEYLPGWFSTLNPLSPGATMRVHAVGNIIFAALLIFNIQVFTLSWFLLFWFITIVFFSATHSWRTAMRDVAITSAVAALIALA